MITDEIFSVKYCLPYLLTHPSLSSAITLALWPSESVSGERGKVYSNSYVLTFLYILPVAQWRKSWGTGRDCPIQSFDWGGTAVLTVPPKFKLRKDTAGSCFVRFHKEYVTHYNFESAIVKLQFRLCILTNGGSRAPSLTI